MCIIYAFIPSSMFIRFELVRTTLNDKSLFLLSRCNILLFEFETSKRNLQLLTNKKISYKTEMWHRSLLIYFTYILSYKSHFTFFI